MYVYILLLAPVLYIGSNDDWVLGGGGRNQDFMRPSLVRDTLLVAGCSDRKQ